MIIYSVTISVDESIEQEWIQWMREEHIPEVMATGKFISCRFSRLVSHKEAGSCNYSAQYTAESFDELEDYKANFAPDLQQKSLVKFADKMLAFRSELQILEDF
jgi:hypothetical protein